MEIVPLFSSPHTSTPGTEFFVLSGQKYNIITVYDIL